MNNAQTLFPEIGQSMLETFGIPESIIQLLSDNQLATIAGVLMDINWVVALPWIPQRFQDEIQGAADGSGIPVKVIRRVNILPELTQAHCSVVGAWGSAATADGKLYHLRALDWEAYSPINQFPTVILYEPSEEGSKPFANIGYLGMIGALTAISKIGITVGEKVMIVDDPS